MFYALSWIVVISLLALWSLAVWAIYAVTAWTVSNAGVLAGGAGAAGGLRLPEWLSPWVPAELARALESMAAAFAPVVEAALASVPALAGALSVAAWVVWGLGSAALVVLGLLATGLIAMLRRRLAVPAAVPAAR